MRSILLVDDDSQSLESTKKILELAGYQVWTARDGAEALEVLRLRTPAIVVSDVRMPELTGIEFLKILQARGNRIPVVLMTAFGQVEDAVWAMKMGAVDFLSKPFKRQVLLDAVGIAMTRALPEVPSSNSEEGGWIGNSPDLQRLRLQIDQIAPTTASVLISGESGTGKEQIAKRIHSQSARARGPWVAVNCAALTESLMEAELFGYEKGAFTGAEQAHAGLFEQANGGTLFLDEVGDMPQALQVKLLRVLQENEIRRVGAQSIRRVDVRLISATHKDLHQEVREGRFREDLLFRLEVIGLVVPPLRKRIEDLPELIQILVSAASAQYQKSITGVSAAARAALAAYRWPGNIRELKNVIERAVILASSAELALEDLPEHVRSLNERGLKSAPSDTISVRVGSTLKDVEDLLIRKTLEATDGDKTSAAKILGINSRTIYRRIDGEPKARAPMRDSEAETPVDPVGSPVPPVRPSQKVELSGNELD